ncbi:pyridoxal-phosphate dependent enzyme [Pedobacter sp. UBA4863]|uniref:pyridoxal-phosphate dependent enzyme n=1 Tax=Pedobacter sp. UBA4863 TaxID=1947060 RepID=UPI002600B4AC|nr:pyridoxal-phosphate dependent enzyme [Pedobacter sp. UBA4863]
MWKYSKLLPNYNKQDIVSLGEGNTPLIKSRYIGKELGVPNLYFKLENLNPSGSYKDRFASAFITALKSKGKDICIATSSGNTGAALSAYSAAAGINCVLAIVDGAPEGKIKQMQLYGAHTYMINGFGKDPQVTGDVFKMLSEHAAKIQVPLPISAYCYCPEGMIGVQTISYEIIEQTNFAVNHIFSPSGGGGLTLAVAKGVVAYTENNQPNTKKPKVHCVQPEGNDTIASSLRNGINAVAIPYATTNVSGLQVPSILDGNEVIEVCTQLGGNGYVVSDTDIFAFHQLLAQKEGVFCEPAGAVALAGLASAVRKKEIKNTDTVVCLVTGSGFKDMHSVERNFGLPDIEKIDGSLLEERIIALDKN